MPLAGRVEAWFRGCKRLALGDVPMQDILPTPLQLRRHQDPMPLIPHAEVIQERLDALPLVTVEAGGAVFLAGSRTDRLLFLKEGSVVVIKDGAEIARVTQPRAVMAHGELSPWADPLGVIEQKRLGGQGVCADRL